MSIFTVYVLAVGLSAAPSAAPANPPKPDPAIVALVHKLGDPRFRVRESASSELLRRGTASVAALNDGLRHPDLEVRERCRVLLPRVAAIEREELLQALLGDLKAPPPKGLPGAESFIKITGDSKSSRELYAEFLRAHHRTLDLLDTNPKQASLEYQMFAQDAYNKYVQGMQFGRINDHAISDRADVTYFLVLAADKRVRGQYTAGIDYSYYFCNSPALRENLKESKETGPAMRKLFLNWLEHEPVSHVQQQGFQVASQLNIKEAFAVALRMLDRKTVGDPWGRGQVMLTVAQMGSKEHLALFDKFLADKTSMGSIGFGNNVQLTAQVRDIAMAAQVKLAGQKHADFGFDTRYSGGGFQTYPYYYGFQNDEARDKAHAKWKEWKDKNQPKAPAPAPAAKKESPTQDQKK